MLSELVIRNFAIIERLQVNFGPGFNVLTGETGAGKSIIIDAVGLLLGDRARPELIRTGAEEGVVEALFDLAAHPQIREQMAAGGLEDGEELLVRRLVARNGKNRIQVNGSLATIGQLQPLAQGLVTIYGQHEHQTLQRPDTHLELLDRFAGLAEKVAEYRRQFERVGALRRKMAELESSERDRQQRLDFLQYQLKELSEAGLRPGEDEELAAERLLLQHAERLAVIASGGYESLYGGQGAVCERLEKLATDLEGAVGIDLLLGSLAETARGALYSLEDLAMQLRDYGRRIALEPDRQQQVEERLALLSLLKRKYAPTLQGVLQYQGGLQEEIAQLADLETVRAEVQAELGSSSILLTQMADLLSEQRRQAALRLAAGVEAELRELAMAGTRFEVRLLPLPEPGTRGMERGEFYISPNAGEELRPLARIASGGELSRIMLALRKAAPEGDRIPTLIFDEIDAGVGGAAATAVGEKLRQVAQARQVLCITHLPQVAAFADRHYRVEKQTENGRTSTRLVLLEGEERTLEMARMLGGARITDRTLEHARELIASSTA
jgi:DNA repair protein RecN (Recombination protein N)